MFRLEDASKQYPHREGKVEALRPTSLTLSGGEYVAIVGPSGSGKTTLLSMLGGMLAPTSGRVLLGDCSLYDVSAAKRAEVRRTTIGFVFQTFNLIPYLTAAENVQVPLMLSGRVTESVAQRVDQLLGRVGLEHRAAHKPSELSVGQQQRVALARTLVNDPAVILADEPTGNLDPESRKHVLEFFDELCREGRMVVMVTHDPQAAERAKRTIKLADGEVADDFAVRDQRVA